MDIDPKDNPNLASLGKQNWRYIQAMLGEILFKYDDELKETIKGGEDRDATLEAVKKIRSQSDAYKNIFSSEANLHKRLIEMLQEKGLTLSDDKMKNLFDVVKKFAAMSSKAQKKKRGTVLSKQISSIIFTDLWQQHPMAISSQNQAPEPLILQDILKQLNKKFNKSSHLENNLEKIKETIKDPSNRNSLFKSTVMRELKSMTEDERKDLAESVVLKLRIRIGREKTKKKVKPIADFLTKSFTILKGMHKKGVKVSPGKSMSQIAAHGFFNLNPKLVTALTLQEGSNLKWLGVSNQDMHHFELKVMPTLPKAPTR